MSSENTNINEKNDLKEKVKKSLMVGAITDMPHLAGLSRMVEVFIDSRVATAGISKCGRLYINPDFFAGLDEAERCFVLAHELMHISLLSHDRGEGSDQELFNIAHDYIINDILKFKMGMKKVPANGLEMADARFMSAEELYFKLKKEKKENPEEFRKQHEPWKTRKADEGKIGSNTDVLSDESLELLDPEISDEDKNEKIEEIRKEAQRSQATATLIERLDHIEHLEKIASEHWAGTLPGDSEYMVTMLSNCHKPPWEMALQSWVENAVDRVRTYARASRRSSWSNDYVMPGRVREGFTINIVMDTSGSMIHNFSKILGLIAEFCESVNIQSVRILQCDVCVTSDELIDVSDLKDFVVKGMGGSDMSPAMNLLAEDPEIESVIVITDGYIDFPDKENITYNVLWAVTDFNFGFKPSYGHVLMVD
jgi:predicted metal-dependent peptidase